MIYFNISNGGDSATFIFETSFIIILNIFAIFLNFVCSHCLLLSCKAFPNAIRLLALNVSMAYSIISIYLLYKSVQKLLIIEFNLQFSNFTCILETCPFITCYQVLHILLFLIAIDRLCITLTKRSLIQNLSSKSTLCQLFSVWLSVSILCIIVTFFNTSNSQHTFQYCEVMAIEIIWPFLIIGTLMQVITGAIHTMLHRHNRKQLVDLEQLRYAQNLYETHKTWSAMTAIMAIKWLSAASQLHSILGLVSGGLTICTIYAEWNGSNGALYIYGFLPVIFTIDCTLHPILCVRYSRTLQRSLTKMFPDKGKVFHTLIRRVLLGSTKIENDANNNNLPVIVVSMNNYAPKVTRVGEVCERVIIKHNISPEKQQEILVNAWNMVASMKEKKVEEVPNDDDRKTD